MTAKRIEDYPPLLTTPEAAELSRHAASTFRKYACNGGPIQPLRLNGRHGPLLWKKSDLLKILGLDVTSAPEAQTE